MTSEVPVVKLLFQNADSEIRPASPQCNLHS